MKRKVIQQGHNALTVTIPSKWAKRFSVSPKDFLNIEEQGNALVISTETTISEAISIEFDITGLSARAIDRTIRALYKKGVDEVTITYKNSEAVDYTYKKKIPVFDVIQNRLNKLINFEIIEQGEHYCKIHDVATSSSKEFYPIVRRMFLLLREMGASLHEAIKTNNHKILETIQHKHDVIAKFTIFCIRTLNKEGYKTGIEGVFTYKPNNVIFYYFSLQAIHHITDLFKESAKLLLITKAKLKKETCDIFKELLRDLDIFYELFYKFDVNKINELEERRIKTEGRFNEISKKSWPSIDMLFAGRMMEMFHHFAFMVEAEISVRCEEMDGKVPKPL